MYRTPPPAECFSRLSLINKHPDTHVLEASYGRLYMARNGISLELCILQNKNLSLSLVTERPKGRYHVIISRDTVQERFYMRPQSPPVSIADYICPVLSDPTIHGMDTVWIHYCQWFVAHNAKELLHYAHCDDAPLRETTDAQDLARNDMVLDWGIYHMSCAALLKWVNINHALRTAKVHLERQTDEPLQGDHRLNLTVELTAELGHFPIPTQRGTIVKITSTVPQPRLTIEFDKDSLWEFSHWDNLQFPEGSHVRIIMPAKAPFPCFDNGDFRTYQGIATLDYSHITKTKRGTYRRCNRTTQRPGGTIITLPPT